MRWLAIVPLLLGPAAVPASAHAQTPTTCLDVAPETARARTGSPHFVVVTLRQKVSGSARCDGQIPAHGDPVRIGLELTGANDRDPAATEDSPDAPDALCRIDPTWYIEARCTIAIWGSVEGTTTVRAWIDRDASDPPDGVTEADRDEGVDETDEPGTGCVGTVLEPAEPEPDCTDVVAIDWAAEPRCYASSERNGDDRIAVHRRGGNTRAGLYVVDADEVEAHRLGSPEDLRLWLWSPDRRHLVYQTGYVNGLDIWTMRADGSDHVRLTPPNRRIDEAAAWSPDSRRVVFGRYDYYADEAEQLYVVPAAGGRAKRLTRGSWSSGYPDWSPDGRSIVFSRHGTGSRVAGGLFTISPRGGRPSPLVTGRTIFEFPQYSPDGRRVLFRKYLRKTEARDLFVVDARGGRLERLTRARSFVGDYEWSPDGRKIVYETRSDTGWTELRVVNADGSNDRSIVRHFGLAVTLSPSWSPNSKYVAYQLPYEVLNPEDFVLASDVWIAALDGRCAEAATPTPRITESNPVWTTQAATSNPFEL